MQCVRERDDVLLVALVHAAVCIYLFYDFGVVVFDLLVSKEYFLVFVTGGLYEPRVGLVCCEGGGLFGV